MAQLDGSTCVFSYNMMNAVMVSGSISDLDQNTKDSLYSGVVKYTTNDKPAYEFSDIIDNAGTFDLAIPQGSTGQLEFITNEGVVLGPVEVTDTTEDVIIGKKMSVSGQEEIVRPCRIPTVIEGLEYNGEVQVGLQYDTSVNVSVLQKGKDAKTYSAIVTPIRN